MSLDVAHIAFPFRLVAAPGGSGLVFAAVKQDSTQHIVERVLFAALTPEGSLDDDPEFGRPDDLLRTGGVDLAALAAGLHASEPDAALLVERDLSAVVDFIAGGSDHITIEVQ